MFTFRVATVETENDSIVEKIFETEHRAHEPCSNAQEDGLAAEVSARFKFQYLRYMSLVILNLITRKQNHFGKHMETKHHYTIALI